MTNKTEFYSTPAERQAAILESAGDFSFELPKKRKVPSIEHAAEVAMDLRTRFTHDAAPIAIVESFVEQNGMGLTYESLYEPNAQATTRLRHLRFGPAEFNIVVNNQNNDRWLEEVGDLRNVHAALIGHEIGHTLFFAPNRFGQGRHLSVTIPIEGLGGESSRQAIALENWCDTFSERLTDVSMPSFLLEDPRQTKHRSWF